MRVPIRPTDDFSGGFQGERGDTHKCVSPVEDQVSGFNSPSIVGISSDTVGWMCTARWIVV